MSATNTQQNKTRLEFYLDAHHRLFIALGVSIAILAIFSNKLPGTELAIVTWLCFAFSLIVPQWIIIFTAHPRDVKRIARLQDSSHTFIFLFVISASLLSLLSILFLLKSHGHASEAEISKRVLLTMGSVIVSWILVHTVFALRYAHLYYDDKKERNKPDGGLQFPEEEYPDYLDLVYFSFVIGMTFQVSDVEISSRKIRRLALLHGLISFAFNTAIVALSINIISGLVSQS